MVMPLSAERKTFSQRSVFSERMAFSCSISALYLAAASSAFFGPSPVSVFVFPSFAPQAASASTISAASSSAVSFFSFILFPPCFFLK